MDASHRASGIPRDDVGFGGPGGTLRVTHVDGRPIAADRPVGTEAGHRVALSASGDLHVRFPPAAESVRDTPHGLRHMADPAFAVIGPLHSGVPQAAGPLRSAGSHRLAARALGAAG